MLIGKWTLQHENYQLTISGVQKIDTIITASANNYSSVQFNKAGTFAGASFALTGNTGSLSGGLQAQSDSLSGTYSFTGTLFNTSNTITGFIINTPVFFTSGGLNLALTNTQASQSVQINQLKTTALTLHTQITYKVIADTFKIDQYLYYTR